MITNLRIKNVALIDEVEITFGDGLNVLTGETGAGKSILVDSINFLLGERPARDFLRSGADTASVEGLIEIRDEAALAALTALDVDTQDRQLMLHRVLGANGKSVCRVNGRTVTVGMLKEISALLVDVHGQHEHQSLLDANKQQALLDQFCGTALDNLKQQLEQQLRAYRENGRAIKALSGFGNERTTQLEIWQFQLDEIQKAKLKPGEEEELMARRARLGGLEKLNRATTEALSLLSGGETEDGAVLDKLNRAAILADELARIDSARQPQAESLHEAAVIISDVIGELRAYAEELDADPRALESVEARLDMIYRLKKKYGTTIADVLAYYADLTAKTERILRSGEELKKLNTERRALIAAITQNCRSMSEIRTQAAEAVQTQISAVLRDVGMKSARFEIRVEQKKEFNAEGNNRVAFMISPNPGEPLKPLNRIASGGEMSRVMLALKTVMADADQIGTLIFDEVDAGVSGRTAQQVAEKLMTIARKRQILCITHLPQIAAMADVHFLIEKQTDGDKTVTSVRVQNKNEIIQELARLIGGAKITDATLQAAGDMKQLAEQVKRA